MTAGASSPLAGDVPFLAFPDESFDLVVSTRQVDSDAPEKWAEQNPAQGAVGAGIANQDAARHSSPREGTATMSHDGKGRGGKSEQVT